MRSAQPSRRRPAAASTMASNCPSSSLRRRVSRLPRMVSMTRSGRSGAQLRRAPQRTGADARASGKVVQACCPPSRRGHPRAREWPASVKPVGQFGGHVLETVHGHIDATVEQRLLDFLGEQSLAADFGQRDVGDLVAGGLDDFDAAVFAERLRAATSTQSRLPQRQLRSAGSDDDHCPAPSRKTRRITFVKWCAVRMRGLLAQFGNGTVRDLVDDAAGESLDASSCCGVRCPELARASARFRPCAPVRAVPEG